MPRIRQNYDNYRNRDFTHRIKIRLVEMEVEQKDLAKAVNVSASRMCSLVKNPDDLTVDRLRKVIEYLHLTPEQVLTFLGFTDKTIKSINMN